MAPVALRAACGRSRPEKTSAYNPVFLSFFRPTSSHNRRTLLGPPFNTSLLVPGQEAELEEASVVRTFRITAADGKTYNAKQIQTMSNQSE